MYNIIGMSLHLFNTKLPSHNCIPSNRYFLQ